MPQTFYAVKDPSAVLDYAIDWATWLGATDTISASSWTVPSGITRDSDSSTGTKATIWLSGGTAGKRYEIVNSITTADGRQDHRTIVIVVSER